uniref:Protein FAF-like, chloroplastic n=1 Tax=Steinernema glaseri TaxID=37863 RepID=A0A1I8AW00_9BILA
MFLFVPEYLRSQIKTESFVVCSLAPRVLPIMSSPGSNNNSSSEIIVLEEGQTSAEAQWSSEASSQNGYSSESAETVVMSQGAESSSNEWWLDHPEIFPSSGELSTHGFLALCAPDALTSTSSETTKDNHEDQQNSGLKTEEKHGGQPKATSNANGNDMSLSTLQSSVDDEDDIIIVYERRAFQHSFTRYYILFSVNSTAVEASEAHQKDEGGLKTPLLEEDDDEDSVVEIPF